LVFDYNGFVNRTIFRRHPDWCISSQQGYVKGNTREERDSFLLSYLLFAATVIWCKRPSPFYEDSPDVSEFIEVSRITEFREGQMKKVMAGSQEVLIARVKERFYAIDVRCPHLDGDLSEGTLVDTTLTCPMHHSQFDIRDGHVMRWTDLTGIRLAIASRQHPPRSLHHYTVRVEGDKILVSL